MEIKILSLSNYILTMSQAKIKAFTSGSLFFLSHCLQKAAKMYSNTKGEVGKTEKIHFSDVKGSSLARQKGSSNCRDIFVLPMYVKHYVRQAVSWDSGYTATIYFCKKLSTQLSHFELRNMQFCF